MFSVYIYKEENIFNVGGKNCIDFFILKWIVVICFVIIVIMDNDIFDEVKFMQVQYGIRQFWGFE